MNSRKKAYDKLYSLLRYASDPEFRAKRIARAKKRALEPKERERQNGYRRAHLEEAREYSQRWRDKNPDYHRNSTAALRAQAKALLKRAGISNPPLWLTNLKVETLRLGRELNTKKPI